MINYLVDYAIKNLWCTPDQDKQYIFKPARITPINGVWNILNLVDRSVSLPIQGVRYHVYQFGGIFPSILGLGGNPNTWYSIKDACNLNNQHIDIYNIKGVQMPRFSSWYMITDNSNLIFAVQVQPSVNVDLNNQDLFFRFYSNAFFGSSRAVGPTDYIKVNGNVVKSSDDILAMQNEIALLPTNNGAKNFFVNGYKVSSIDLITTKPGDVVEYVYDASIFKIVDLPINTLQTFNSTLDNKNKLLLHYDGLSDNSIDYHDDIDFFIILPDVSGRHKGVYFHRNSPDAIRNVTHRDYSIVTDYITAYLNQFPGQIDISNLVVRLHIRKSGYLRPLVKDSNRIEELYKLPNAEIIAAMVGIDATVPNWKAETLENSSYIKIMGNRNTVIDPLLIQDALGYNTISKMVGDTPTVATTQAGTLSVPVPINLVNDSVAYEYDVDGTLINYYQHPGGTVYPVTNPNCTLVEMVSGIMDPNFALDEYFGADSVTLDPALEYRFYTCSIVNGVPANDWVDVTNTTNPLFTIINNVFTWNVDKTRTYTLVRSNKKILSYDLLINAFDGLLDFSINYNQTHNGVTSNQPMTVPMGDLEIMLNKHSLIEGVDYIVKFPEVFVINKSYLVNVLSAPQRITVRHTGFCKSDLTFDTIEDKGFVKFGLLSKNGKYNIRDDKVLRIVLGGKVSTRDVLKFSETDLGVTVPNALNGLPYSVKEMLVPLKGVGTEDTYVARSKSLVIDKAISDYMTLKLPEATINGINTIASLYPVFSPFCCKIIYDLQSGVINDQRINGFYDNSVVMDICKPYEYILPFDPISSVNRPDVNYVRIDVHNLFTVTPLTPIQYKFLVNVMNVYCKGLIDISNSVSIA